MEVSDQLLSLLRPFFSIQPFPEYICLADPPTILIKCPDKDSQKKATKTRFPQCRFSPYKKKTKNELSAPKNEEMHFFAEEFV